MQEIYLTTAEVAAYLRLKERTIYDLVARQAIPCSRVTGKLIFPRRLVDAWVEANVELADRRPASPPPIVAGSSDPLLEWALRESGSGLATLLEGSGAGLERLAAGEAVAAGLHLPGTDGADGNRAAVAGVAGIADLVLIRFARRQQGLVLARDNPMGISRLGDLAAKAPRLIRRQAGAGAQALLEALLDAEGIPEQALNPTEAIAMSEAEVATAIADGAADCGLAIGAVARRFGLDFLPLAEEAFDLACRRRFYFEPALQRLFAFVRTPAFAEKAAALGHYSVEDAGTVGYNA